MNQQFPQEPQAPRPNEQRPEERHPMQDMRQEVHASSGTRNVILLAVVAGVVMVGSCAVLGPLFAPSVPVDPIAQNARTSFDVAPATGSAAAPSASSNAPAAQQQAPAAPAVPVAPDIQPVRDF